MFTTVVFLMKPNKSDFSYLIEGYHEALLFSDFPVCS